MTRWIVAALAPAAVTVTVAEIATAELAGSIAISLVGPTTAFVCVTAGPETEGFALFMQISAPAFRMLKVPAFALELYAVAPMMVNARGAVNVLAMLKPPPSRTMSKALEIRPVAILDSGAVGVEESAT